ncbi:MAG: hypothetical protein GY869_24010 [Planctomycetes bacterium]|nr:hypothetical protein [Planctomycetota bacterium]
MKQTAKYPLIRKDGVKQSKTYRYFLLGFALLVLHWGAFHAESPSVAIGNISPQQNVENPQIINRDSASGDNPGTADKQEDILSREEYKIAIITKNIFHPAKSITSLDSGEIAASSLGPEPLRNPFKLQGIQEKDQGMRANLWFEKPTPRGEEVAVGHVIEEILTILAIEPTFIRCNFSGSEVRISVNESSTDAWMRLSSNRINYILLGTVQTDTGYVAHIKVIGEDAYRTVEYGDELGDATVITIEEGYVLLIDGDGNEIPIRAPLLFPSL